VGQAGGLCQPAEVEDVWLVVSAAFAACILSIPLKHAFWHVSAARRSFWCRKELRKSIMLKLDNLGFMALHSAFAHFPYSVSWNAQTPQSPRAADRTGGTRISGALKPSDVWQCSGDDIVTVTHPFLCKQLPYLKCLDLLDFRV
jgi:hypothetical protein